MENYNEVCYLYNENCEITKFVLFKLHRKTPNYYRSAISFSYFKSRECKKWINKNKLKKYVFRVAMKTHDDYLEHMTLLKSLETKYGYETIYSTIPKVYVETIWDMYKEIGYDYKKQKFVE